MKYRIITTVLKAVSFILIAGAISCSKDDKKEPVHSIGESYQGGKIAYILQSGDPGYDANKQHGIIAAESDQNGGVDMAWSPASSSSAGGVGSAIGTGMSNTSAIVTAIPSVATAARVCFELVLNGYDDWFLPSKDELQKVYLNKASVGNFPGSRYWSSTESNAPYQQAVLLRFDDGAVINQTKSIANRVRAVRSF